MTNRKKEVLEGKKEVSVKREKQMKLDSEGESKRQSWRKKACAMSSYKGPKLSLSITVTSSQIKRCF